jgi:hypothetical protein
MTGYEFTDLGPFAGSSFQILLFVLAWTLLDEWALVFFLPV